jgi:DNA-directed RNA polymerase specialized sigma24 family protein
MEDVVLTRVRAGDGDAFRELTEHFRRELQLHCYRILDSVQDAEDAVQETLLAAWRGIGQFEAVRNPSRLSGFRARLRALAAVMRCFWQRDGGMLARAASRDSTFTLR